MKKLSIFLLALVLFLPSCQLFQDGDAADITQITDQIIKIADLFTDPTYLQSITDAKKTFDDNKDDVGPAIAFFQAISKGAPALRKGSNLLRDLLSQDNLNQMAKDLTDGNIPANLNKVSNVITDEIGKIRTDHEAAMQREREAEVQRENARIDERANQIVNERLTVIEAENAEKQRAKEAAEKQAEEQKAAYKRDCQDKAKAAIKFFSKASLQTQISNLKDLPGGQQEVRTNLEHLTRTEYFPDSLRQRALASLHAGMVNMGVTPNPAATQDFDDLSDEEVQMWKNQLLTAIEAAFKAE